LPIIYRIVARIKEQAKGEKREKKNESDAYRA